MYHKNIRKFSKRGDKFALTRVDYHIDKKKLRKGPKKKRYYPKFICHYKRIHTEAWHAECARFVIASPELGITKIPFQELVIDFVRKFRQVARCAKKEAELSSSEQQDTLVYITQI